MEYGTLASPHSADEKTIYVTNRDMVTSGVPVTENTTQPSLSPPESPTMESQLPILDTKMREATVNITLTTLGVGCLSLPYSVSILGVTSGLTTICVLALATFYALYVLTDAVFRGQAANYSDLMERLFGKIGSTVMIVSVALYAWSGAISFLVIIKTSLGVLMAPAVSSHVIPKEVWMVLVATMVVFPLSLLRNMRQLWFTSMLGCISAIWITIVVVICAPWKNGRIVPDDPNASERTEASFMTIVSVFPLITFSLNMALAYIPNISTLRRPTTPRVLGVITISIITVLASYLVLAIVGYLSYGNNTKDDILSNLSFPLGSWRYVMVIIARAALVLQLSFAIPIRLSVARVVIEGSLPMFDWSRRLYHVVLTFILVVSATLLAIPPISLSGIMGVISSTTGVILLYIGPASCDLAILLDDKKRAGSVSLLVWTEHGSMYEQEKNNIDLEDSFHKEKKKGFTLSAVKQDPLEHVVKWTRIVLGFLMLGFGLVILVLGTIANFMKLIVHSD